MAAPSNVLLCCQLNGRENLMKTRTRVGAACGALLLATVGYGVGRSMDHGSSSAIPERPPVVMAEGLDLLASQTAADWVESASVVAVVTAVDERSKEIDSESLERGEGEVGRWIDLRIDDVLWTNGGPAAPSTVSLGAEGWVWKNHDPKHRTEFGLGGRPRLEVGQQYLVALTQFPGLSRADAAICGDDAGPDPTAAAWGVIGEYGSVPVTDGVVGPGEFQGTLRTLDEARAAVADAPQEALRDTLLGQPPAAVVPHLERAAQEHPPKAIPAPTC